jgi:hypothetical protein
MMEKTEEIFAARNLNRNIEELFAWRFKDYYTPPIR